MEQREEIARLRNLLRESVNRPAGWLPAGINGDDIDAMQLEGHPEHSAHPDALRALKYVLNRDSDATSAYHRAVSASAHLRDCLHLLLPHHLAKQLPARPKPRDDHQRGRSLRYTLAHT